MMTMMMMMMMMMMMIMTNVWMQCCMRSPQTLLFGWIWCQDINFFLATATKQQRPDGLVE